MVKKRFLIAGLSLLHVCGYAQGPTPGVAGAQSLQNILSSRVYHFNEPSVRSLEAGSNTFFTDMDGSLDYGYQHMSSKLGDGLRTDTHTVYPGIYLEYNHNTSITASFAYSHADGSDNFLTDEQTDIYGPRINIDQELLNFFGVDTAKNSFTLEADFAYSRADFSGRVPGPFGPTLQDHMDIYDFGPTLIFVHPLILSQDEKFVRLNLTLSPAYDHDSTRHSFFNPADTSYDLFSALARLDYGFSSKCFLGVYGSWERYLHQSGTGGLTTNPDWARCGAAFTYKPGDHWLLNAGYYYEAFNSNFDSHNVTVHAEYHF